MPKGPCPPDTLQECMVDHRGANHKVFMVVTGWESEEAMKSAVGGEKRARVEENLREFKIQQHEHVSRGLNRIK
ncbi:hypothetical protein Ct61P_07831 [Colletotrichum tofieldiae]|nr:hypothetical protein Ct61P_07831 [Colletotrichum tofieldiae]